MVLEGWFGESGDGCGWILSIVSRGVAPYAGNPLGGFAIFANIIP